MCARYYPNGSNRPKNPDNPLSPGNERSFTEFVDDNDFTRWLYETEWTDSELQKFEMLYAVSPTKEYIDYLLDRRFDAQYMARYGITSADIKDPRRLRQVSSASASFSRTMNFVSDSARWLYK